MQPLEDESSAGHEHQIGEKIKMQKNNLHKLKIEKLLCHGKMSYVLRWESVKFRVIFIYISPLI